MPQSGRDFYAILGVPRDADADQLKKAYRKLSLKFHPDKNKGEDAKAKFQDVAEAFAVLSDPEKRKVFDRFGEEGLKNGMSGDETFHSGGQSFHMPPEFAENLFAQFFGGGGSGGDATFQSFSFGGSGADDDIFGSFGKMPRSTKIPHGRRGGVRVGGFQRFDNPQAEEPLPRQAPRKRPAIERDLNVTLEELCEGVKKKLKISRKLYDGGSGQYTKVEKTVELPLAPQMKAGTKFTLKNMGNEEPGFDPADLIFNLKLKPHERFERIGDDLYTTVDVDLKQALIGGETVVETLDKKNIRVPFGPVYDSKKEVVLKELGMPNKKTNKVGNLHVRFNVKIPESLDKRAEIAALL